MLGGIRAGDDNDNDDDDFEPVSPHPVRRRNDLPRPSLKRPRPPASALLSPGKPSLTSSATILPLTSSWTANKRSLNSFPPPPPTQSSSAIKSSVSTTPSVNSSTPSSSKGLQRTGSALSLKRAISKNAIPKSGDSAPSRQEEPLKTDPPAATVPSSTAPIIINDDSDRIPDSSQEQTLHNPPQTPSRRPKKFKSTETVRQQVVSLTDTPDDNFTSDAIIKTINIPMSTLEEQERLNKMQRLRDDQEDDSLQLALAISRSMDHSKDGSVTNQTSWSMASLNSRKGKGRRKVTEQEKNETTVLPLAEVQHLIQANVSALLFPEEPKRNSGTSSDFTKKTPPWPPSRFVGTTKADKEFSLSQSSEPDPGSTKRTLWDLSRFKDEHRIDRLDLDSNPTEGDSSQLDVHQSQDLQQPRPLPVLTDRDQYVTRFMAQYLHREKNTPTNTQQLEDSPVLVEKKDTANVQAVLSSSKGSDDKPTFSSPIWSAPSARRISFKDQSKALDRDFAVSLQKEITIHLLEMERIIQEAKSVAYHKILQSLKRQPITSKLRSPEPMDLIPANNNSTYNLSQELEQEIIAGGYHPSSSPLLRYSKNHSNSLEQGTELVTDISLENSRQVNGDYSVDNYQEDSNAGFLDCDGYQPDFSFELNRADNSYHDVDDFPGNEDNIQETIHIASSPSASLSFAGSQSQKSTRIANTGHASPIDLNRTPGSLGAHLSQQQEASPSFSSPVQLPPPLDFAKLGYHGTATQSSTPPQSISPPPARLSKNDYDNNPPESPWVTTPKRPSKTRRFRFDHEESDTDLNRQGRDPRYESDLRSPIMSDLDDDMDDPPLPRIPSRPRSIFKGKMPIRNGFPSLTSSQRRQQALSLSPSPPPSPTPPQLSQLPPRSKINPLYGLPLLKKFTVPAVGTSQQHAEAAASVSTSAFLTSATSSLLRTSATFSRTDTATPCDERSENNSDEDNGASLVLDDGDRMSPVLDEVVAMSPVLQDEDPYPGESTALSQRLNMSISPQTLSNAIAASSMPRRKRGAPKKNTDAVATTVTADRAEPTPPQTPTKRKRLATLRAEALAAQTAMFVANLKAQGARPKYETMSVAHLKVLAMKFGLKPSGKTAMVEQLNAIWTSVNPDADDGPGEERSGGEVTAVAPAEARGNYRDERASRPITEDEDDILELASNIGAGSLTVPYRRELDKDFPEPLEYGGAASYDFDQDYEQDHNHYDYDPWADEQMDNRANSPIRWSPMRASRRSSPGLTVHRSAVEGVILSNMSEPVDILDEEDDNLSLLSEGYSSQGKSEIDLLTGEDTEDEENEGGDEEAEGGEDQDDPADQELDSTLESGLEDLERQLCEFLRSTSHLRQQYLTYKPLDLESLWEESQGANIHCTREQLRHILDKQGIICFVPAHSILSSWRKKRAGKVNKRRKQTDK